MAQAIAERVTKHTKKADITIERVLNELAGYAFASSKEMAENGLKASDKIKSIELLGKYLKMFTDRIEHGGSVDHNHSGKIEAELGQLTVKQLRELAK